jgi:pantetheine-phosphate adenylyltransferase
MRSLYAASFDPITKGHEWIIANAPGQLTIAVANNNAKKHCFTLQQRFNMVTQSVLMLGGVQARVEVVILHDTVYLASYAREHHIDYLIRGVRSVSDYEYEKAYADVNRTIEGSLIHLLMVPPPELSVVSSSVVRSLVGPNGWENVVSKYVSSHVVEALRATSASLFSV